MQAIHNFMHFEVAFANGYNRHTGGTHTHLFTNDSIEKMAEHGVATNVHYKPLPMMTAYEADIADYPNSYEYYRNLITLPLHTLLTDEDVAYVCEIFKTVVSEYL